MSDFTEKILLVVIPSAVSGIIAFLAAWKLNQATIAKLTAEIRKAEAETRRSETDTDFAIIKNQDYWMNKFQIGLRESLKLEEENSDYKMFARHAMRFFAKLRRKKILEAEEGLLEELGELEHESDTIQIKTYIAPKPEINSNDCAN